MATGFENLKVWQECRELRKYVSKVVKTFPNEEKYRLVDQSIRSSRSITANTAEGDGRFHFQENIQFCRQARGSLKETLDHFICALDEDYLSDQTLSDFQTKYDYCLLLLNGYIAYLKKRKEES